MPAPQHVFVLMLENRSFDHLFGFSDLTGVDPDGKPTAIDGLTGKESNTLNGVTYPVTRGAAYVMPSDPGHEFLNVLDQLCGASRYAAPYPSITTTGFVDSYVHTGGGADPGEIMRCFDTASQLPVLHTLAKEFAICDRWFSALPGPTWPNRLFVHAASSAGLDHSPATAEILEWETVEGFAFPRGHVFQALAAQGIPYRLYSGDDFPMVAALKNLRVADVARVSELAVDLARDSFPYRYVFIEPSYEVLLDYRGSSSMHPFADVRDGERLVKQVYEAIRASKVWESSMLVVMWDEHGGFYDHVVPEVAVPPGDGASAKYNQSGFTFAQYGVRTPALVISPLVPRGTIDHRLYDHSSVLATLEELFALPAFTARDKAARSLLPLASLGTARTDAPMTLPTPVPVPVPAVTEATEAIARPEESVNGGMVPSILHSALRQDLALSPENRAAIFARVAGLQTRADAMAYLRDVQAKLRAAAASKTPT